MDTAFDKDFRLERRVADGNNLGVALPAGVTGVQGTGRFFAEDETMGISCTAQT